MGWRESLQVFHPVDVGAYVAVLQAHYSAKENPHEPNSYLIDTPPLPFYHPSYLDDHLSILGFNNRLLSDLLVVALIQYPELAPQATLVRWLSDQDLIVAGSLQELARHFNKAKEIAPGR